MRVAQFIIVAGLLALTGCDPYEGITGTGCIMLCDGFGPPPGLPMPTPGFDTAPTLVVGLPDAIGQVSVGADHACARTTGGAVWCWGENGMRQTVGEMRTVDTPARVALNGVAHVAVGASSSCALTTSGAIYCWGYGYGTEPCETSPALNRCASAPAPVAAGRAFTSLTVGNDHACGISDGALWCWGHDVAGQLGRGTTSSAWNEPGVALDGRRVSDASAGLMRTCAIATDPYMVLCWGAFMGTDRCSGPGYGGICSPQPVSMEFTDLAEVHAGDPGGCGRTSQGDVVCWEAPGAESPGRYQILTVGHGHACGLSSDSTVRCWGTNRVGQLGNGVTTDSWVPRPQVVPGIFFVSVDAGFDSTCGVTDTGQVYCWGDRFANF